MRVITSKDVKMPGRIDIQTLEALVNRIKTERPVLEMARFLDSVDNNLCATSCCLAGWGMEWKIGTTPEIDQLWAYRKRSRLIDEYSVSNHAGSLYTDRILSASSYEDFYVQLLFEWAFGANWSNDIDRATKRLEYLIQHESCPAIFSKYKHSNISLVDLVSRLPSAALVVSLEPEELPPGKSVLIIEPNGGSTILLDTRDRVINITEELKSELYSTHCTVSTYPHSIPLAIVVDVSELQEMLDLLSDFTTF